MENDLDLRNVFQGLKIKGAGSSKTDRLPVTDDQLATLLPAYATSPVPEALFVTLADTGARLVEIVGLEAQDLDLGKGCLNIRHNTIRRLKTKTASSPCLREPKSCSDSTKTGYRIPPLSSPNMHVLVAVTQPQLC